MCFSVVRYEVENSVDDSVFILVNGVVQFFYLCWFVVSVVLVTERGELSSPPVLWICVFLFFGSFFFFFPFCFLYFEAATGAPLGTCSQVRAVRESKRKRRKIAAYVWAGHFPSLPLFSSPWESSGSCFLCFTQSFSCDQWVGRLQWAYSPPWPHVDFERIFLLALAFRSFTGWMPPVLQSPPCTLSRGWSRTPLVWMPPPFLSLSSSCLSVSSPDRPVSHLKAGGHGGLVQLGTSRPPVCWHRVSGLGSISGTNYCKSAT